VTTNRARARLLIATAALSLILAGCGEGVASSSRPAGSHSKDARLGAATTSAASPSVEVYAVPGSGSADAQIFSQAIGSSASQHLGSGIAADVFPTGGTGEDLAVYRSTGGPGLYSLGGGAAPAALSTGGVGDSQPGSVLMASGNDVFVQASGQIVELDSSSGSVIATYNLPSLTPDSVAGSVPPYDKALQPSSAVGTVQALIESQGDLFALQYTGTAAAIDNLTTGAVQQLSGFGALGGGTLAPDGDIYVLAWRPNDTTVPMSVLQIDPGDLSILGSLSTGLSPAPTDNIETVASPSENVLVYVVQGDSSGPIDSYLWSAAQGGGLTKLVALPANVGLDMSLFGNDVYLYGGPAENQVSELDLTDMSFRQNVGGMSAPTGSYLLAMG
jgi:hypothetical protein